MKKPVIKTFVCFAALFALLSVIKISGDAPSQNAGENTNSAVYLCAEDWNDDVTHKL